MTREELMKEALNFRLYRTTWKSKLKTPEGRNTLSSIATLELTHRPVRNPDIENFLDKWIRSKRFDRKYRAFHHSTRRVNGDVLVYIGFDNLLHVSQFVNGQPVELS